MERRKDETFGREAVDEMVERAGLPGAKPLAVLDAVIASIENGEAVSKATVRRAREALRALHHQVLGE